MRYETIRNEPNGLLAGEFYYILLHDCTRVSSALPASKQTGFSTLSSDFQILFSLPPQSLASSTPLQPPIAMVNLKLGEEDAAINAADSQGRLSVHGREAFLLPAPPKEIALCPHRCNERPAAATHNNLLAPAPPGEKPALA